ncbi:hypothetical protein CN918_26560 [Priestia megaterium]|nr:hypothetical protein CN918_26560 [Priestia megaterium]
MIEFKILDKQKPILYVKFSGNTTVEEIEQVERLMKEAYEELGRRKFYILGDSSEAKVLGSDTKKAFIEHQLRFTDYVLGVATVRTKAIIRNQFKSINEETGNNLETDFDSYEKALAFLKSL